MIYYQYNSDFITVSGQTYPHRTIFKTLGGYFLGPTKSWRMPFSDDTLGAIDGLCRQYGGGLREEEGSKSKKEDPGLGLSTAPTSETPTSTATAGESTGYRVSELLDLIHGTITRTFASPMWIVGEVQNLSMRGQRGAFFNLAEQADSDVSGSTLSISAVMWGETLKRLEKKFGKDKITEILQDGLSLRVLCQVQFYRGRAQISLAVHDIDPAYTQGALALAREKLLKELRSKGLDLANKQRPLSAFPFRVGLITAHNSRAASDFLHQLELGRFCGEVLFYAAAMQGEASPKEVQAGIQRLVAENCDIIVVTRGGGSAADLRWFDTPEVAYAIVECKIPIVAAIGHHDDRCVAEEICYQREKTPTAAADFIVSCFEKAQDRIERCITLFEQRLDHVHTTLFEKQNVLKERLKSAANDTLTRKSDALLNMGHRFATQSQARVSDCGQTLSKLQSQFALMLDRKQALDATRVQELVHKLQWQVSLRLERLAMQNQNLEQSLEKADPRPWLKRGWTQLWQGQKQIQSIHDIEVGSSLWTRLIDGLVKVQVTETIAKKESTNHE